MKGANPLADVELSLSPELNSIIGGRGSGKSTLLEYVAFGLARSCFDLPGKEYSGKDRLVRLVRDTLIAESGEVGIVVTQDGADFEITRGAATGYQPLLRYPNGKTETLSDKELRSLIPSYAYSQGELSELGGAREGTKITDLLAFVEPSYKQEADALEQNIAAAKEKVAVFLRSLMQLWTAATERAKTENRISALRARITGLQSTLPKLEPADQAVLDRHASMLEASQHIDRALQDAESIRTAAETFAQESAAAPQSPPPLTMMTSRPQPGQLTGSLRAP